jgi:3-keto-disaccharide hydrolase
MNRIVGFILAIAAAAATTSALATAQQPPAGPGGGQGRGAGGGRGGPIVPPVAFEDRTGFESMFDGKSLTPGATARAEARKAAAKAAEEAKAAAASGQPAAGGRGRGGFGGGPQPSVFQDWDGDPKFWRVENGVIVGESTPDKTVGPNTFLIWKGGTPGDFELKVEIKMNSTNSGIQYRSKMLPPNDGQPEGTPGHAWRLGGYQMDLDFDNRYPGQLYEEAGRGFLAERGTITYISRDGTKGQIGSLENADVLKALFKPGEWNQFHLIARGNTLIHIVNGHVTAVCVDDDVKGRAMAGLIGFQLHAGPPMKLEIRNVAIKLL